MTQHDSQATPSGNITSTFVYADANDASLEHYVQADGTRAIVANKGKEHWLMSIADAKGNELFGAGHKDRDALTKSLKANPAITYSLEAHAVVAQILTKDDRKQNVAISRNHAGAN